MASLDTLPPDQRAVLQLVLQRGRSYGEIAQVLSIATAAVRQRALAALEALGPSTRIPVERREEISDYLLGQLPAAAAERARNRIAGSPPDRAWARVVASELTPLAATPLPEIPTEAPEPTPAPAPEPTAAPQRTPEPTPAPAPEPAPEPTAAPQPTPEPTLAPEPPPAPQPAPAPPPERPTSRRGGAIVLVAGALVAVAVVVVVIVLVAGSDSSNKDATATAARTTTAASTSKTSTTSTASTTSTPTAQPIAQVNLISPRHSKKTVGIAEIIRQGAKTGLVIVAQGIPANTSHDAYAVWLYNSHTDNHILGFVNPGVKTDGKLQTAGALPSNAARFKRLLVTLETQPKPHGPGKVILEGPLILTP